ncbi:DUF2332 domain-containing protein [Pseudorhodobacter wandonensis]|jgi:hypothetical protein|uniref:DUF2332 domain-containing protein n=1 Tax=Pseudorhodobacter wandonensis TaxID=1120568 RepID=UPI00067C0B48|nr:DUF2332 family protein [Pseudorhodobacter wandonensis]
MTPVRDSFVAQAQACESLGSPFTARILRLLAEGLTHGSPVADRILGWQGDPSSRADALALRLAGGLHALALQGQPIALHSFYANPTRYTDIEAMAVLLDTVEAAPDTLMHWLDSPPQTNEVRRSAVLIAAGHWLAAKFGLPMVLSELGASAGLNLNWDHYALDIGETFGPPDSPLRLTPEWRGPLPPHTAPQIIERRAVDLNPLCTTHDSLRIRSYIWADQPHRMALTQTAISLGKGISVEKGDAVEWLETRLRNQMPNCLHLIYHTVAWQYFPAATQARGEAALQTAGQRATATAPLAHLAMESDGTDSGPGAALTLRLWPGNQVIPLGRVDFHGRWVDWQAPHIGAA